MAKYVCSVCGYEYDEATGDPDNGIAPGTKWEDIPEDFTCPLCGVGKDQCDEAYEAGGYFFQKIAPVSFDKRREEWYSIENLSKPMRQKSNASSQFSESFCLVKKSSCRCANGLPRASSSLLCRGSG